MALDTILDNVRDNLRDNLRDGYRQLVPGTFQHADQLMNERRTNVELQNQCFYTADGMIYFLDRGVPKLAITRESENLVLRNIDDAFKQLTQNGNYRPNVKEAMDAIRAENTVVIDLTKLRLLGDNDERKYLSISTTDYNIPNAEKRKFAERVYGQENDFIDNMKMLEDAGIGWARIYVLNPTYVQNEAKVRPIVRASWLDDFYDNSYFDAYDRDVNNHDRLRGVRRKKAEPGSLSLSSGEIIEGGLSIASEEGSLSHVERIQSKLSSIRNNK